MPAPDVGNGATVGFGTSAVTFHLRSISFSGVSREAVDITDLGDTVSRKYIPTDLYDPGEMSLECLVDGVIGEDVCETLLTAAAEVITITLPLYAGAQPQKLVVSGFATGFEMTVPEGDLMVATVTCKLTGTHAWSDEA